MPTPVPPARRRQLVSLGLVAAVVGGIVLRFATTSPLWLDEALSVRIASLPFGDIPGALRHDGHPPLYYWLLHGWMQLFGDGDLAVRSLSGVFSVLSLPVAWRLADRTGGPRLARWSLLLLALSPFAVRYATEARMYSLVMLLALLLALALDSLLRSPTWARTASVALLGGTMLWTHYWTLYLLGAVGIALLVRWRVDVASRTGSGRAVVGLVAGGLLFLPWLPAMVDQLQHTGTPWARPSRPTQVAQVTLADLGGGGFAEALLLGTLLAVFVVAAFAQTDRAPTTSGELRPLDVRVFAVLAGGTMVIGSMVAWIVGAGYASRYGAVVAPFVLVVAAVGITRLRPTWLQVSLVGLALVLAVVALGHNVFDPRTRADEVAQAIVAAAGPADVVVVCPDQLGPSLMRALDQEGAAGLTVLRYPDLGDPRVVDWRDYEERNERADPGTIAQELLERADGEPIWVVWSGGYRTFIEQCETLLYALRQARGEVADQPYEGAFEVQHLVRYP